MPRILKILSKSLLDLAGDVGNWRFSSKFRQKSHLDSLTIYIETTFEFRARMRMNCFLSKFSKIVNFGLYHPVNVILKTELAKIEFFSVMKSRLWFNDREY